MTVDFVEEQFPVTIAMGSRGGPQRSTQIVTLGSGDEKRNARWQNSRRKYDIGYGLQGMNNLFTVFAWFEAMNAQAIGFRFRDWADWKSCPPDNDPTPLDQAIAVADSSVATYQLIKNYTVGPLTYSRKISKPVAGTVTIAVAGVQRTSGWTVDTTTGLVTFSAPLPTPGATITAGYEFDVPVRFAIDYLEVDMQEFAAGKFTSIPLMELPIAS